MAITETVVPTDVEHVILMVRGHRVMLDVDLARLYGVATKALLQAVRRNIARFPEDFAFELSNDELNQLKGQFGRSSSWGGRRNLPYAFTEQGVAMLSTVLRSLRAVEVNIEIMRAFVRLRRLVHENAELARKLYELEQKYDEKFREVFDAIRELMTPEQPKKRIGFEQGRQ